MARCFYYKLKGELMAAGLYSKDAAKALLISDAAFSQKLNARSAWTLDEMYQVMDLIGCDHSRMAELFPRRY